MLSLYTRPEKGDFQEKPKKLLTANQTLTIEDDSLSEPSALTIEDGYRQIYYFRGTLFVKPLRHLIILLMISILPGCGQPPDDMPQAELHPFSGIVNVGGNPAKGAMLTLHPSGDSKLGMVTPHGVADENGLFILTTYTNADGAPAGKYKVTVSWADVINPGASEPEHGPEKLPRRYQNKDTSGLEVNIEPSMSDVPVLELTTR